jgi:hypothetical protein
LAKKGRRLSGRRDIRFRFDQKSAGDANDPLFGSASGISREFGLRFPRDILPNDGKIAILELKEIRASTTARASAGDCFRSRSKTSKVHDD